MAGRSKGTFGLSANFEPQIAVPIDARMLVSTYNDLLETSTWLASDGLSYAFKGMIVGVAEDSDSSKNGIYMLMGLPVTNTSNWDKIGDPESISADEISGAQVLSGFSNTTDSTITMNGTSFEIAPTTTSFDIYIGGKLITISSLHSVSITNDRVLHFVYFDNTGTLQVATSVWSILSSTEIPVATVFREDNTVFAVTDERHSADRNRTWHYWAHMNIGAMYRYGLQGTFTNTTFSITQGIVSDEDLAHDTGGTKTTTTLWHRDGVNNSMVLLTRSSSLPYVLNGSILRYDNAGVLTDIPANQYGVSWIYATGDTAEPIYTVIGQAAYGNLAAAQNAALPEIRLSTAEWKLLYKVIYRNTNPVTVIEAADFRTVRTGVPTSSVTTNSHTAFIDRDATASHPATAISLNTASFTNILDATVVNTQLLAEAVDDLVLPTTITTTVNNTTAVVDSFADTPNGAIRYDYYIESSSTNNIRAGIIIVTWHGGNNAVNIAEVCNSDIGVTTDFVWSAVVETDVVKLRATADGQYTITAKKHTIK